MTWRDRALCAGSDIDFFDGPVHTARALCAACPVREDCLDDTMRAEGNAPASRRYGISGGYTSRERARLAVGLPAVHGNCRTDPHTVAALIAEYVQEHGTRRGAIVWTAKQLDVAHRTVTAHLRRIAA